MQTSDLALAGRAGGASETTARPVAYPDLRSLLRPRSVALVGATERSMWSVNAFANLRRLSPDVEVFCISPTRDTVHGVPAARSLTDLGRPVDLAYVMSPRETVPDIVREAAATGTRSAVVLTAGFGETEDGRVHQRALVGAAQETGVHVLGPNGSGFVDVAHGVAPFGLALPPLPDPGRASFVLQSGGLMKPLLGLARSWGVGVGMLAGTGNEASLSVADVARYLVEEEDTGAVGLFVEAFRDAGAFRELAVRALELDRPLVVLTVGRSEVARRSAQSHTGALAGNADVTSAVLRDLGVVEVRSMEELVATTDLLARGIRPRGGRIGVVSASGGSCELVADKAAEQGLTVPELPSAAADELATLLPGFSHVHNPLDVTGYATVDPTLPVRAAQVIAGTAADAYDILLFQAFVTPGEEPPDPGAVRAHFASIADMAAGLAVPVLLQDEVAVGVSDFARRLFADLGLIRLPGIEPGLDAVAHAVRYTATRDRLLRRSARHSSVASAASADSLDDGPLTEVATLAALQRHGVPVVPHALVRDRDEAVAAASSMGGSVVLKVCSADVAHKSDVGGVVLDVRGDEAVAGAFTGILETVAEKAAGARIDGVLVAPFRPGGIELIVGVNRDPVWGVVLVLGIGGVLVELLADVAIRPLPVTTEDVEAMLRELRGAPLLEGVRGREPADVKTVAEAVRAVADAALAWGDAWDSIEVNPLRVQGRDVEALDALVIRSQSDNRTSDVAKGSRP